MTKSWKQKMIAAHKAEIVKHIEHSREVCRRWEKTGLLKGLGAYKSDLAYALERWRKSNNELSKM